MSQPLRIRKQLAEVRSMDGEKSGDVRKSETPQGGVGAQNAAGRFESCRRPPSTLLQGREYIPASEHTGASGLRRFLDRQIARGLKPREYKDYF